MSLSDRSPGSSLARRNGLRDENHRSQIARGEYQRKKSSLSYRGSQIECYSAIPLRRRRRGEFRRSKSSALFYNFYVSCDTQTLPPLQAQCIASPALRDLSSLLWHMQHLAGGHQHMRDEFPHTWCLPIYISVAFPGVFSRPDAKIFAFTSLLTCCSFGSVYCGNFRVFIYHSDYF